MSSMNPLMPIVFIFLFFLAILWFLLPFAIFGTKDKLQALIDESIANRKAIENLGEILDKKTNHE